MSPNNERSAEWLRGAICVCDDTGQRLGAAVYRKALAAAEAREDGGPKKSADEQLNEAIHSVYAKYGTRLDLFFADVQKTLKTPCGVCGRPTGGCCTVAMPEATQPTAEEEVIKD